MFLLSALALAGALPAAAAAKAKPAKAATSKWLLGKEFTSVSLAGHPVIQGRAIGLRFFMHANSTGQPEKPFMGVAGGCNSFGSAFRVRKGRLVSRGGFTGTDIGCSTDPDPWLQRMFRKGLKARVLGGRLILTRPADGVEFVFERKLRPPSVKWLLDRSFRSIKIIGYPDFEDRTLRMGFFMDAMYPEKRKRPVLGVGGGCNSWSSKFRIRRGRLFVFGSVFSTAVGCFPDDPDAGLRSRLSKGGMAIRRNGSRLILSRPAEGLRIVLKQRLPEPDDPARSSAAS